MSEGVDMRLFGWFRKPNIEKYMWTGCNHKWVYWDHLSDECTKCGKLKQTRGW